MFYARYMFSELRRRSGRTILTALGLALGVGLVVTVSALAAGLDRAQDEVLKPLTGVGTDMTVTRPISFDTSGGGFRRSRRKSGGSCRRRTAPDGSVSATSASPARSSRATTSSRPRWLPGVHGLDDRRPGRRRLGAAGGLTLNAIHVEGTVPQETQQPQRRRLRRPGAAPGRRPAQRRHRRSP